MRKGRGIACIAAAFCALAALFALIWTSAREQRRQTTCVGVRVEFADSYSFVSAQEVEQYLKEDYGTYIGQRLDSLNLLKVEKLLNNKRAFFSRR